MGYGSQCHQMCNNGFRKTKNLHNGNHKWASKNIPRVTQYKYLGVWLQSNHSRQKHISSCISSAFCKQFALRNILKNQNISTKWRAQIIKSHIIPCLTYGMEAISPSSSDINRLETTQNKIIRSVFKINKRTPTKPIMLDLNFKTITRAVHKRVLNAMHKIRINMCNDLTHSICGSGRPLPGTARRTLENSLKYSGFNWEYIASVNTKIVKMLIADFLDKKTDTDLKNNIVKRTEGSKLYDWGKIMQNTTHKITNSLFVSGDPKTFSPIMKFLGGACNKYTNTKSLTSLSTCPHCDSESAAHIAHWACNCPAFTDIRKMLIQKTDLRTARTLTKHAVNTIEPPLLPPHAELPCTGLVPELPCTEEQRCKPGTLCSTDAPNNNPGMSVAMSFINIPCKLVKIIDGRSVGTTPTAAGLRGAGTVGPASTTATTIRPTAPSNFQVIRSDWNELFTELTTLPHADKASRAQSLATCIKSILKYKRELTPKPNRIPLNTLNPPFDKNLVGHHIAFFCKTSKSAKHALVTKYNWRTGRFSMKPPNHTHPQHHPYKGSRCLQRYHEDNNIKIYCSITKAYVNSTALSVELELPPETGAMDSVPPDPPFQP